MLEREHEILERIARIEQHVEDIDTRGSHGAVRIMTERVARVEQHVEDIDTRGTQGVANLRDAVTTQGVLIAGLTADIEAVRKHLEDRDTTTTKERRDTRLALWSLTAILGAACISALGAILASGAHP